jgi:LPXTG-motif cell wall-anchored protein
VLKEWTSSDKTPEILTGLKPGKTYTIHEKTAPDGYPKAPDSKFVLKKDGSLDKEKSNVIEATDGTLLLTEPETAPKTGSFELTKIIKGDVTEEEAEGSLTFIIKAQDGRYLRKDGSLVSEQKDAVLTLKDFEHVIGTSNYILKITTGETGKYTVTEMTKDIDGKTVTAKYTTTVDGKTTEQKTGKDASVEIQTGKATRVDYENTYKNKSTAEKTYKIRVLRTDPETGKPVKGAVLKLIDKTTGEVIDTWTSADTPHTVEGLKAGHTYIIHEEKTPEGYKPAPDYTLTLGEGGAIDKTRSNVITDKEGVILITKPKDQNEQGTKPSVKPADDGGKKPGDSSKDNNDSSETKTKTSTTDKSSGTSTSSTSTRHSTTETSSTKSSSSESSGAKTGDDTNAAIPAASALAAITAILLLLRKKRQQKMK